MATEPTGCHCNYRGSFHSGGVNHSILEKEKSCIKAHARIVATAECQDCCIVHVWK